MPTIAQFYLLSIHILLHVPLLHLALQKNKSEIRLQNLLPPPIILLLQKIP